MRNRIIITIAALLVAAVAAPATGQSKGAFAKPEALGLSAERLGWLDAAMQDDVDKKRKAGMVVLVARHGKIAHLKATGMSSIETGKAMTTDAMFRLQSQTKPMVSVGLLMLYEQGKFALNDPVEKYIPSFARLKLAEVDAEGKLTLRAPSRKPTILDIFRHTSGFPATTALAAWPGPIEKLWMANGARFQDQPLADQVEAMADLPLAYEPGAEWRYGPEHEIQGRLIEIFSGMRLDAYMRERIFKPLGMKDTDYAVTPDRLARYTTLYGSDRNGGMKPIDTPQDSWYIRGATATPMGGWGVSSTAYDQFRFGQMLLNGGELDGVRLLSRKTVEMMLSNQLPEGVGPMRLSPTYIYEGLRYGLGIGIVGDIPATGRLTTLGAANWGGSASTDMVIDLKEDMIIVALTQWPGDAPWRQRAETLAYQALVDEPAWKK